jgi:hypothetical protein
MIKNVQCFNISEFKSAFSLDSDFIQLQFRGENIESLHILKNVYSFSIIQHVQAFYYKEVHYEENPFQKIKSNQIIEIKFGEDRQYHRSQIDFSIFKNIQVLFSDNNEEISKFVFKIIRFFPPDIFCREKLFKSTENKYKFLSDLLSLSHLINKKECQAELFSSNCLKALLNPKCKRSIFK